MTQTGAREPLPAPELDCICEGDFPWACGPECICVHHAVRDGMAGRATPEQMAWLAARLRESAS